MIKYYSYHDYIFFAIPCYVFLCISNGSNKSVDVACSDSGGCYDGAWFSPKIDLCIRRRTACGKGYRLFFTRETPFFHISTFLPHLQKIIIKVQKTQTLRFYLIWLFYCHSLSFFFPFFLSPFSLFSSFHLS